MSITMLPLKKNWSKKILLSSMTKLLYRSYSEDGKMTNSVSLDQGFIYGNSAKFDLLKSRSYQFSERDLQKDFSEL